MMSNDGIPDIIVRNSGGNLMVVNWWTNKFSTYTTKYIYYEANSTREYRRKNPFIDLKPEAN